MKSNKREKSELIDGKLYLVSEGGQFYPAFWDAETDMFEEDEWGNGNACHYDYIKEIKNP